MGGDREEMSFKVYIDSDEILKKRGLGKNKEAQKFLASEVERLCQPYVPFQQGTLQNSAKVGDDEIIYPGPYAHYQYYGEVMAGRAPKHYTGKPIKYHGGPMRGKEWEKRMMADRKDELCQSVENYIKKRSGR